MLETIETPRLILRHFRRGDAPELARLIGEWEVVRWLSEVPHPYGREDAMHYITRIANGWSFAITDGRRLLGGIAISGGLGFWLGRRYWGRGYMSEAAEALVGAWFAHSRPGRLRPGLRRPAPRQAQASVMGAEPPEKRKKPVRLISGYYLGNAASAAIHAKLGFEKGEVVPQFSRALGREMPLQRMVLRRAAWEARHG